MDNKVLSMDELDRRSFQASSSPLEHMGRPVALAEEEAPCFAGEDVISLDGQWSYAMEGGEGERLNGPWEDGFAGAVPGSVHMALWKAGRIPDPILGDNQKIAREYSYKTWWLKRGFSFDGREGRWILDFQGVADKCAVWLNGREIASHRGMFGGPSLDVTEYLEAENTLIVRLNPIPFQRMEHAYPEQNESWRDTVVLNSVYGWHYSNMPSLGIWQSVRLVRKAKAGLEEPFLFTRDAQEGRLGLMVPIRSAACAEAELSFTIRPLNFEGPSHSFQERVSLKEGEQTLRYELTVPNPHLWWPNGLGEQDRYEFTISLKAGEGESDSYSHAFGIRTIEMRPLPQGPSPEKFDWTFCVNGREAFIHGAGWCVMDALLDLSAERYERFLSLAADQHVQMLRAWGGGIPEKDEFYAACDRYGILVMQEWPTAWDSHLQQPYDILEETVACHTRRLRNFPSLAMYGGGNESPHPFGKAIDMMGRLSIELDGTRPFHRGEPFGGSDHDYDGYWGEKHIDHHLTAVSSFWGEFGYACLPIQESCERYLPEGTRGIWPLEENKDFVYHTPVFGTKDELNRLRRCSSPFLPEHYTFRQLCIASQLAQALGVRRVLERSRTRWPECTGALYYKLNDNFPAMSWASIDWYGAPKLGHYVFQDSFESVHACVLFQHISFTGQQVELPVYLLDDAHGLCGKRWQVEVMAYDAMLRLIREKAWQGEGTEKLSARVGSFLLNPEETDSAPLFIVCDVTAEGERLSRSFYFANFEQKRGCLFSLPRAGHCWEQKDTEVVVRNTGRMPAVGVWISCPGASDRQRFSDNFLWLEPGESQTVKLDLPLPVKVEALNGF